MAEFSEVIKQKKRMCNSTLCCKRDIYRACGEDLSRCQPFVYNNPQKAEEIIMRWSAEHQKPVYPSWGEYLASIGVMKPAQPDKAYEVWFAQLYSTNIPADIAQKLGIEPKEGIENG